MNATVPYGLRTRSVSQVGGLLSWVNHEAIPVLDQSRRALNYTFRVASSVTTAATGTFTTIWASDAARPGTAWLCEARIIGRGSTTARSGFIIRGLFYNDGTLTQEGATSAEYTQNAGGFAVQFAIDTTTNKLGVQVKDAGGLTVVWRAIIDLMEDPLP